MWYALTGFLIENMSCKILFQRRKAKHALRICGGAPMNKVTMSSSRIWDIRINKSYTSHFFDVEKLEWNKL